MTLPTKDPKTGKEFHWVQIRKGRAPSMTLKLEFALHEPGFFTVSALIMPKDPELRYALADDQTATGIDAERFKKELVGVRFPKAPEFKFIVIVAGNRRPVVVPLPDWPVSSTYVIRKARFMGTLKL